MAYLLVLTILQLLGKCLEAAAGRGAVNRRLLRVPHSGAALTRLEAPVGVIALVTWLGLGLGVRVRVRVGVGVGVAARVRVGAWFRVRARANEDKGRGAKGKDVAHPKLA